MASWMVHLRIADKLLDKIDEMEQFVDEASNKIYKILKEEYL